MTREVQVMASLNHPNIVRYYDSWFDAWALDSSQIDSLLPVGNSTTDSVATSRVYGELTSGSSSSQSNPPAASSPSNGNLHTGAQRTDNVTHLYIRMELCQAGTLQDWLDKYRDHRPMETCVKIFKSVTKAINYLHDQRNLMHRDIKVIYCFTANFC